MKIIILILLAVLACSNTSKINKIEIFPRESQETKFERIFFYREFNKHKNFESFIKENNSKKTFLMKHSKRIQKYYSDFQNHIRRMKSISGVATNPLVNVWDSEYYGKFSLGTPAQDVYLFIDTGSADLIVATNVFIQQNSTTFATNNTPFEIEYASGQVVNGFSATDVLQVAGLTAKDFQFAITPGSGPVTLPDGIIGMGYTSLSNASPPSPSLIRLLYEQNQVNEPVFSLFFTRDYNKAGSSLVLGGVDSSYYEGPIYYFPVLQENFYQINYDGYQVGDQLFPSKSTIIDSGTTLIHVSSSVEASLTKLVGKINPDCSGINDASYPVINVVIGGIKFPLTSIDYIFYRTQTDDTDNNTCIFGIVHDQSESEILGDQFLKAYYSVFDHGKNTVGFAKAKPIGN